MNKRVKLDALAQAAVQSEQEEEIKKLKAELEKVKAANSKLTRANTALKKANTFAKNEQAKTLVKNLALKEELETFKKLDLEKLSNYCAENIQLEKQINKLINENGALRSQVTDVAPLKAEIKSLEREVMELKLVQKMLPKVESETVLKLEEENSKLKTEVNELWNKSEKMFKYFNTVRDANYILRFLASMFLEGCTLEHATLKKVDSRFWNWILSENTTFDNVHPKLATGMKRIASQISGCSEKLKKQKAEES